MCCSQSVNKCCFWKSPLDTRRVSDHYSPIRKQHKYVTSAYRNRDFYRCLATSLWRNASFENFKRHKSKAWTLLLYRLSRLRNVLFPSVGSLAYMPSLTRHSNYWLQLSRRQLVFLNNRVQCVKSIHEITLKSLELKTRPYINTFIYHQVNLKLIMWNYYDDKHILLT